MKIEMLVSYSNGIAKQYYPSSLLSRITDYSSTLQLFTFLISHLHKSLYPTYCNRPTTLLLLIDILLSHNLTVFAL